MPSKLLSLSIGALFAISASHSVAGVPPSQIEGPLPVGQMESSPGLDYPQSQMNVDTSSFRWQFGRLRHMQSMRWLRPAISNSNNLRKPADHTDANGYANTNAHRNTHSQLYGQCSGANSKAADLHSDGASAENENRVLFCKRTLHRTSFAKLLRASSSNDSARRILSSAGSLH